MTMSFGSTFSSLMNITKSYKLKYRKVSYRNEKLGIEGVLLLDLCIMLTIGCKSYISLAKKEPKKKSMKAIKYNKRGPWSEDGLIQCTTMIIVSLNVRGVEGAHKKLALK